MRTRYAGAFAQVLEVEGISSARVLNKVGISERLVVEDHESWMPVKQIGDLAMASVHKTGRWDIGLVASMIPRAQHSSFSKRYLFKPTLFGSLRSMCENSDMEDTSCDFKLIPRGDMTWLDLGSVNGPQEAIRQIELYRLGSLLEVIRRAGGKQWLPSLLHLQSVDDGRLRDVPLIRDMNVQFGTPHLAIQIPTRFLSRTQFASGIASNDSSKQVQTKSVPFDDGGVEAIMKSVVKNQMRAGAMHIKDVASSLDVSKRTFQRILKEYDLTFSDLLEQTRMETAQNLLAQTDMSHHEISNELGYRHSTHFSRAFRRVCGMTPRQYRKFESPG